MLTNKSIWHPFTQMKNFSPLLIKSAKGIYLTLHDGKEVMDMISSWWTTTHGHSNPNISKAIYKQSLKLEHVIFADFQHPPAQELVKNLKTYLPSHLNHFFFSDNGSSAVEIALKTAFQYWHNLGISHKKSFISFSGAYHGDTIGAMSVSSPSIFTKTFSKLLFHTEFIPFPFIEEKINMDEKEQVVLSELEKLISQKNNPYCALIIEPLIQGAGGMRICRNKFLEKLQVLTKTYNLPVIYDEIMTGFGRTGKMFSLSHGCTKPDIICLSKGLTGGTLPLALTISSDEIYNSFLDDFSKKTFFHGHSFTANPLGCIAALESLKLLKKKPRFSELENLHKKFLLPFYDLPNVKNIRVLGTIAAMNFEAQDNNYLNNKGRLLQKKCLDKNVYIRPLGNGKFSKS